MPEWIVKYWVEWAFGVLAAGLLVVYRRLAKKIKDDAEERAAIKAGMLAILHDRLYQVCTVYIAQGWIDTAGLKNLEYLYKSYHTVQPGAGAADSLRKGLYYEHRLHELH